MVTTRQRIKDSYTEELKGLLSAWDALQYNKAATTRDHKRYRERIQVICNALDEIEKNEKALR